MTTKNTTPAETTPETFSFPDWFSGANRPENSADVYLNSQIVGDIEELHRRIELESAQAAAAKAERTVGSKTTSLEKQYIALAKQFTDSKMTFYVRGLTMKERKAIREAHDAAEEGNEQFILRTLVESIVGLRKVGGERVAAKLSLEQLQELYDNVGDTQIAAIYNAQLTATNGMPSVDADFLHKLSGLSAGPES